MIKRRLFVTLKGLEPEGAVAGQWAECTITGTSLHFGRLDFTLSADATMPDTSHTVWLCFALLPGAEPFHVLNIRLDPRKFAAHDSLVLDAHTCGTGIALEPLLNPAPQSFREWCELTPPENRTLDATWLAGFWAGHHTAHMLLTGEPK